MAAPAAAKTGAGVLTAQQRHRHGVMATHENRRRKWRNCMAVKHHMVAAAKSGVAKSMHPALNETSASASQAWRRHRFAANGVPAGENIIWHQSAENMKNRRQYLNIEKTARGGSRLSAKGEPAPSASAAALMAAGVSTSAAASRRQPEKRRASRRQHNGAKSPASIKI